MARRPVWFIIRPPGHVPSATPVLARKLKRQAASPMITLEKLRIYERFNGDIDGKARAPTGKVESHMTDADWHLIDELLMGLTAMGTGLASPSFARGFETKLLASTSDEATRSSLRALAVQQGQNSAA